MYVKGIIKLVNTTFGRIAQVSEKNATNAIKSGTPILKDLPPLKPDIVELSAAATRWTKPAEEYIPNVVRGAKGYAVPMHHKIHRNNVIIDGTLRALKGNMPLTSKEKLFLKTTLESIYDTDKAFTRLKPLETDVIGYRGRAAMGISHIDADFPIVNGAKVGDIITPHEGYSYLGLNQTTFEHYAPSIGTMPTIRYTIQIPKGTKVSRNLEHNWAIGGEIIMPRSAQYKVIYKSVNENNTDITLEYILPEKDNLKESEELLKRFNIPISKACRLFFH